MRSGIIFALCASLVLVGGASWLRLSKQPSEAELAVVERIESAELNFDEVFRGYTESSGSSAPISSDELIGRQFISDYVALAAKGAVSEETLEALAEKYVESIPSLNESVSIPYQNLKIVQDSPETFKKYDELATREIDKFKNSINSTDSGINLNVLDDRVYSMAQVMSRTYDEAARKFIEIPVPASLSLYHHKLINSFLSSAAAMKYVAGADTDAAKAFAGIVSMSENVKKEEELMREMGRILTSYEF